MPPHVRTTTISKEAFYNKLYWDHRIYDIRSRESYGKSHICRAHNMYPYPIMSADSIITIEKEIDDEYGKSEHPSAVLIYKSEVSDQVEFSILYALSTYLRSSSKALKDILILADGFENFQSHYPYLCSDSIDFQDSVQLVWPSCVLSNLYLGSSMCRNERILSLLKITHVMSFSDYLPRKIETDNIKTIHWQISDSFSSNLLNIFPLAVKWISDSINNDKGNVLVHCDQGVSRSASIVIAYLLASTGNFRSVDEAFNFVKSKREVIRPNASFLKQLEEYFVSIRIKVIEKEDLSKS